MSVAVSPAVAVLFGATDQYLGSLTGSGHAWAAGWSSDLSLLSAPWLLLPFLAGTAQRQPTRAAFVGLVCTYAALLGYAAMTFSPVEDAHVTFTAIRGFMVSERLVLLGGVVTGPIFGWLGQRWQTRRAVLGMLPVAAALCFEPLARRVNENPIGSKDVSIAEVVGGLLLVGYATLLRARRRPHGSV